MSLFCIPVVAASSKLKYLAWKVAIIRRSLTKGSNFSIHRDWHNPWNRQSLEGLAGWRSRNFPVIPGQPGSFSRAQLQKAINPQSSVLPLLWVKNEKEVLEEAYDYFSLVSSKRLLLSLLLRHHAVLKLLLFLPVHTIFFFCVLIAEHNGYLLGQHETSPCLNRHLYCQNGKRNG